MYSKKIVVFLCVIFLAGFGFVLFQWLYMDAQDLAMLSNFRGPSISGEKFLSDQGRPTVVMQWNAEHPNAKYRPVAPSGGGDGIDFAFQEAGRGGDDEYVPPNVLVMQEPDLVATLRDKFLAPPPEGQPLNLSSRWLMDTSMGQAARIREILGDMRNGFYVECGALDGETRSNTLVFERQLGWSGLLIEADPLNYESAVLKRRQAFLSNACLSTKPYAMVVSFHQNHNLGRIEDGPAWAGAGWSDHVSVQCFPLYTYLVALNRTTVDYFSLDVEGSELEVLQTIPWDRVNIRALSVEYIHGKRGKEALRAFMERMGYHVHSEVTHFRNLANDFIFVKNATDS